MAAYYNEIEPFAAAWLRNLSGAGLIAPGEVDERSIEDVTPDDLRGFTQCHFFAGIGVWSHALRLAGWPDDREVWTGSCPCQPFSAAGKRGGTADERHLWPAFFHLIEAVRPAIVLGEQVASKDGLNWLDLVSTDLEGAGYAFGATDLCAAGVGAPHIRQRLWFVGVADSKHEGSQGRLSRRPDQGWQNLDRHSGRGSAVGGLADGDGGNAGAEWQQRGGEQRQQPQDGGAVRVEQPCGGRRERGQEAAPRNVDDGQAPERQQDQHGLGEPDAHRLHQNGPGPTNGFWRDADWLLCRDERWRPVRPGTFPLVNGAPARVGRLRAYGNAIVAQAAREFIEAVDHSIGGDLA